MEKLKSSNPREAGLFSFRNAFIDSDYFVLVNVLQKKLTEEYFTSFFCVVMPNYWLCFRTLKELETNSESCFHDIVIGTDQALSSGMLIASGMNGTLDGSANQSTSYDGESWSDW